jgi:cytochrome c556
MLSEQQIAALPSGTHVAEHHYGNTWSATVYFGEGGEARDAMRLFADAVRTGQLVAVQADGATVEQRCPSCGVKFREIADVDAHIAALAPFTKGQNDG